MKQNTRLFILIFTLTFTLLTVIFGITVSATGKNTPNVTSSYETFYILKEYEGRPAVFKNGESDPLYTLEVFISQLPERDKKRIKNGISADTLEEILQIAEDYE